MDVLHGFVGSMFRQFRQRLREAFADAAENLRAAEVAEFKIRDAE
jgi:hypothetical protein